jgi:PBP1b-binding outer membrane lipoprotein LpoB
MFLKILFLSIALLLGGCSTQALVTSQKPLPLVKKKQQDFSF